MEPGKQFALTLLPKFGFSVEEIPVATGQTADLLVTDSDSQQYLIEVKEKIESPEQATERIGTLSRGDLYQQADPLARDNSISGIYQNARKQLDATPKADGTFQLIWFHATGVDADLKARQALSTFYGNVPLFARVPNNGHQPECFYFDYSAAFNMPTIDALILSESKSIQLCLNEFATRANDFRQSAMYQKFTELGGIIDPTAMEARGEIIACRATIPRKNDDEICKALQEQTGVLYTAIRLTRHTVSAATAPGAK